MLSFVSSWYKTGKSWGMCPYDSDRSCSCLPDSPGLPPCRPRMPGGFVWLFRAVQHASNRTCATEERRCVRPSELRLGQLYQDGSNSRAWGSPGTWSPGTPGTPRAQWGGKSPGMAVTGKRWFHSGHPPEKPHRLIPPTSQHQIEYVQLNVFVQVLGTSLHEFYSIYKWRELIFRCQPNPLEVSTAIISLW